MGHGEDGAFDAVFRHAFRGVLEKVTQGAIVRPLVCFFPGYDAFPLRSHFSTLPHSAARVSLSICYACRSVRFMSLVAPQLHSFQVSVIR
jgi:hypothetical protein